MKEEFDNFDANEPWFLLVPKIFFNDLGDEIEGMWLEPVFKIDWEEDSFIVDVELKGFFFFENTMVDFIDELNRCFNVILVASNLDEIGSAKFLNLNVDLECRSGFSITDSRKGSDEAGCANFKHSGRHAGEGLVTWVKVELQLFSILSREVVTF